MFLAYAVAMKKLDYAVAMKKQVKGADFCWYLPVSDKSGGVTKREACQ